MKLAKSLLLGSATAFVAVAGANAADLPSKKAAPINYVKVCDAYGAGFYTIPGTETCIKVGGRVRADFAMSGKADQFANNVAAVQVGGTNVNVIGSSAAATPYYVGFASSTAVAANPGLVSTTVTAPAGSNTNVAANGIAKNAGNLYGWEARARVDLDARTPTAYGTVQAVASLRLARTTGVLAETGPNLSATSASPTLEAAYIRFAGFTFGAARDNFSIMPSTFYGAGHWSSFANGAKQIAYTAVLGGGFSATLAVQDAADTTAGGVNAIYSSISSAGIGNPLYNGYVYSTAYGAPAYSYNQIPQINGRVDFDQSWGTATVVGAVGQGISVNSSGNFDAKKTIWAAGGGLKLNLPMIAAGDVLWLNGAYADGMTEYTTNWTSFKSSDTRRNVGGYVLNHPSWIAVDSGGANAKLETLKSWNLAAIFTHFWAPQWRHSVLASYGKIDGTTTSKALAYGQSGAFGNASVWNAGTQLVFLPTKDFEIGVDVLYARVEQDIRRLSYATAASASPTGSVVTKEKEGNWTGRLRVERTF